MRPYAPVAVMFLLSWLLPTEILSGTAQGAPNRPKANGLFTVTTTVALEPITGPPESVTARIIRLLDVASRREKLALLNYDGATADCRLQGDLQAVQEENMVKVTYSWLVFDQTGELIGSTSGIERVPATDAAPWSTVSEATLKVIADQGIATVMREAKPNETVRLKPGER